MYIYLLIHAFYRSCHLIFLRLTQLRTFDESGKQLIRRLAITNIFRLFLFMSVVRDSVIGIPAVYGLDGPSLKWELSSFPGSQSVALTTHPNLK